MAMIFPGMDPYLEHPQLWTSFHARFIIYLCDFLQPLLGPRYIATVEDRVFIEGPQREVVPDVWVTRAATGVQRATSAVLDADEPLVATVDALEVHETHLDILDRDAGEALVTLVELVSPSNKFPGPGRDSYLAKQSQVRASRTRLVEIDLLRAGQHVLAVPEWLVRVRQPYDYLVSINRAIEPRNRFEFYPRRLRERLPRVRIPLADDDPDVVIDLQAVVDHTYTIGVYRNRLRYGSDCVPPLPPDDQQWANTIIKQAVA